MHVIAANDNRYVVKKAFNLNKIKDMELLSEIKGFWGATTVIKDKNRNAVLLCEKIQEANIIEETVHDKLIHVS